MASSPLTQFSRALIVAFQFLTRLPTPALDHYQPSDSGHAFALFPLVGLCLGALLTAFAWTVSMLLPSMVVAALVLILWVLLTGGLHLDGLGDSADGWLAGGDKERTLRIMKDPRSGSAAVVMIGCLLVLKFAALSELIAQQRWWWLCLTPMLARAMGILLYLLTPYANPTGLAGDFLQHSSGPLLGLSIAVTGMLLLITLPLPATLWLALVTGCIWLGLRQLMLRRLGGTTGDTSGALIEIVEAGTLVVGLALS